jgi:hypothetical protein
MSLEVEETWMSRTVRMGKPGCTLRVHPDEFLSMMRIDRLRMVNLDGYFTSERGYP